MNSRRLAQALLASTIALAGLATLTGTAGAQTTPDGCLILSLQHGDNDQTDPQTLLARTPVDCPTDDPSRVTVYAHMQTIAADLATRCGTFQVDLTTTHETWTTWPLGTPFTADAPSEFLSAIPDIAGVGTCDTPTPPTETAPPVETTTTTVTPPADPTPTVDIGLDGSAPGISVVKVTTQPVALAATGPARTGMLAMLGVFMGVVGAGVVALSRRVVD